MNTENINCNDVEAYFEQIFQIKAHLNGFNDNEIFYVLPGFDNFPILLVYNEDLCKLSDLYIPTDFSLEIKPGKIYSILRCYNNNFVLFPSSVYNDKMNLF